MKRDVRSGRATPARVRLRAYTPRTKVPLCRDFVANVSVPNRSQDEV